jgi:tRNA pseudouridine55 synthase
VNGVRLVDKPAGVTSHDMVARVRREVGRGVKVGHSGTLDPFATGLLLILLGRATRVQRFLLALPKSYETTAHLGWRSSTGDRDGEISRGADPPSLSLPVGRIRQRPPAYSAIKIDGRRAYSYARAGEEVEIPEREVEVFRAELLSADDERASYAIDCSSGTYIRSLIMDLGDAYCESLRRTAIGPFSVDDAGTFVPLDDAISFIPSVTLSGDDARRAAHGVAVPGEAEGTVRLLDADGLIALAEPRPDGTLKPFVGFRG